MALSEQELINEVRGITGYSTDLVSDSDIQGLIETAKADIQSITENYSIDWYDESNRDPNRALMWTTCLFLLLKARELDGVEYSLESLEQRSLSAAGGGFGQGNQPTLWYQRATDFIGEIDSDVDDDIPYGMDSIVREDRIYGGDDDSGPTL